MQDIFIYITTGWYFLSYDNNECENFMFIKKKFWESSNGLNLPSEKLDFYL